MQEIGDGGGIEILKGGLSGVVEGGGIRRKIEQGREGRGRWEETPKIFVKMGGGGAREMMQRKQAGSTAERKSRVGGGGKAHVPRRRCPTHPARARMRVSRRAITSGVSQRNPNPYRE